MPEDLLETVGIEDTVKAPLEDAVLKKFRKLTQRTYLGLGYIHTFINDETQAIMYVPCSQAEYESMQGAGGASNNPTLAGHTWLGSVGGTDKVDTPDTMLGEDEYCVRDTEVVINLKDKVGIEKVKVLLNEAVDANGNLDEAYL